MFTSLSLHEDEEQIVSYIGYFRPFSVCVMTNVNEGWGREWFGQVRLGYLGTFS